MAAEGFFITGGNIPIDAASYVVRHADQELLNSLRAGQFCYMLDSRQVGKSSLMVRAVKGLRAEGRVVCVIDLQSIGNTLDQTQWYLGLLDKIGRTLDCEDEVEAQYAKSALMSPFQRWMAIFDYVILPKLGDRSLIIFVDEIDIVRSLKFSTDEFFLGIRDFHNRRSLDPRLEQVTFCLLGSAAPADLIQEKTVTPFNVGKRIDLTDFTESEAMVLADGFSYARDPQGIVRHILWWTGGHPYLTQMLCAKCLSAGAQSKGDVDRICEQTFLTKEAIDIDSNLSFVRDRILRGSEDPVTTLLCLRMVRGTGVRVDESSSAQSTLLLAGIVRATMDGPGGGRVLHVRNQIYGHAFGDAWIDSNLPEREVQREETAKRTIRKGVWISAGVAAGILALVIIFMIPIFREAKISATKTESLANLRTYLVSVALYQGDYDDRFPRMEINYAPPNGGVSGLYEAVAPYTRQSSVQYDAWQHPHLPNSALSFAHVTAISEVTETVSFSGDWLPDGKNRLVGFADATAKWIPNNQAQELLRNSTKEKVFNQK